MFSGDTIGKYRLVSRLGRGGMGEVWLATASGHGGFTKTVVLKTLLPELACDPMFIEMLAHEARICAKLSHPNLIEVFDFTEHGGIYLLAMEHVIGRPLHHIMRAAKTRNWEIPAWFALRIAWECCRGLECAHDLGVIHCDLSPSNVMVTFTGVTKILDFGVAHSSAHGPKADALKGKFPYMAPERIKSRATDRRTDIYSLGVMLYLLFTGQLPFTANSDAELLHMICTQTPRPPSELCAIDPRIEQIILRAMKPNPAARHQTVGDMIAALAPILDGQLGTYGQHDVATLVTSLFAAPDGAREPRQLPPVPDLPGAAQASNSDVITGQPSARYATSEVAEIESFDIEVESSVLEIPREVPARKPLPSVFVPPAESRTSVQSLFGERPSRSFGRVNLFDRAPTEASALGSDPGTRTEERWFEPSRPEPDPEPPSDPASRGVFGGYTSSRPAAPANWPWPSSRSKSK